MELHYPHPRPPPLEGEGGEGGKMIYFVCISLDL